MHSSICTLFEGHYHYGVAALINSLFKQGFRGEIYAGYKGNLPDWARLAKESADLSWPGSQTWEITEGLRIHFLPLNTDFHLANYKPYFMLRLWDGPADNSDAIAYFDPDIVVKCNWQFFEDWMNCGIALVQEIANSPMPSTHPTRLKWKEIISECGYQVTKDLNHYFNSGFCGVLKKNIDFLNIWCQVIDVSTNNFGFNMYSFLTESYNPYFKAGDQDAMNIAAMCSQVPISEVGPYGMDFSYGDSIMSHSTGNPKPWKKNFLLSAFKGFSPSRAEKSYWLYANGLIHNYSSRELKIKNISIAIASALGRFYSKN